MLRIIKKINIIFIIIVLLLLSLPVKANAARTNITVAVNCNMPPFQFLDKDGNITGLHIDIMNEIAKSEDLVIVYMAFNETSKVLEAVEEGLADIALGITSKYEDTDTLKKSDDITSATLCLLAGNENIARVLNKEQDQLRYSIAFELGTISYSQLSQLTNVGYNIVAGNQRQLYEALTKKQVEAVIGIKESMIYMLENNNDNDKYTIVHNYISSIDYTIVTRRNDLVLYNSINQGIGKLRASNTYEQLLDKWIINTEQEAAREIKTKMLQYITAFVLIASIIISIISYMNYKLKKLVDEKTKEIGKRIQQLEDESILREKLIEFSPACIMLLKSDGSVLMMNSVARNLTKKYANDLKEDINIRDIKILNELYQGIISNNAAISGKPVTIKCNKDDGENLIFRCQCQSINTENDMVIMFEDITNEEKEKYEIFELSKSKALTRIIAGIAHEIKNPLMSINTFASLIQKQGKDQEFIDLFYQHVPQEVDRINRLINMLINYSRPIRSNKERVLVSELVNDSVYFAKISSKNTQNIDFITDVKVQAYIYVNRDQIKQSLINLIMNSIQSVEEKLLAENYDKHLTISVSGYRCNNLICLEVYDEGCGMNDIDIERCIEPFYTTKAKGLGMGLALTKQFVNDNLGRLEIESRKNEYTTIRMLFEEDTVETTHIDY